MVYNTIFEKLGDAATKNGFNMKLASSLFSEIKNYAKTSEYELKKLPTGIESLNVHNYDVKQDLNMISGGFLPAFITKLKINIENSKKDLTLELQDSNHDISIILKPKNSQDPLRNRKYTFKSISYKGMLGQYIFP